MNNNNDNVEIPSLMVYIAASSALLGALGMGGVLAWTAPAFEDMLRNDSIPRLTHSHEDKATKSWIGACITLGALTGGLMAGPFITFLGRKKSIIIYGIPFTIGWILISVANSVSLIIIGRVITGFCSGLVSGTVPTYVIEISTPSIRGLLGVGFQVFVVLGILMVYSFGAFMSWNHLAIVALIPCALMSILMIFMPETPIWLMSKNRNGDAKDSLIKLRHKLSNIDKEMKELEEQTNQLSDDKTSSIWSFLIRRDFYKPFILSIGLMFFQQFSGVNTIMFYATDIFEESGSSIDPKVATILIGVAQVVGTLTGCFLIDRLGRRILLFVSSLGDAVSLAVLGYYYYRDSLETESVTTMSSMTVWSTAEMSTNSYGWVPVTCLIVFTVFFAIGLGAIPWMMIPEMTTSDARKIIAPIATSVNWAFAFFLTKEFADLEEYITKHGSMWLFMGCMVLSMIFVIVLLPETKGKTNEQIQRIFLKTESSYDSNNHLNDDFQNSNVSTISTNL